ncbi:MAG: GntG family PLP-dependent aldolase [Planctomycetota bacterium]
MSGADFRSDTITRPSARMRAAMAEAEVGDDVLDGDPTVRALEAEAAAWLGQPGALFVPSGTMANQVALGAWTRPGDEIVVQRYAHVTTYEAGAAGYLHGLQSITLGGIEGDLDPAEFQAALRPLYIHCPRTALLCLEQTHNVAGGRVMPLERFDALTSAARAAGVPVHLDGARLANAVVASGVPGSEWGRRVDSVSLCFSKGLGAPVGSVIAGGPEFLERAKLVRKRLGGWMRQCGILAAAARMALAENVARLADDHRVARDIAARLGRVPGLAADVEGVHTNIANVQVVRGDLDAARVAAALAEHDVQVFAMGPRTLRFVAHMDLAPDAAARLESAARRVLA